MQQWQVNEAKARFSSLIQSALDEGPQIISKHGHEIAAVVPISLLRQLQGSRDTLVSFFAKAPRVDLQIERDRSSGRDISF